MYWYRYRLLFLGGVVLLFCGCSSPVNTKVAQPSYFGLKQYFAKQAISLSKQNLQIVKTVTYNGIAETKTVTVVNWQRELDLFSASDINKPAWKASYQIEKNGDSVVYKAIDTTLRTRRICIRSCANRTDWGIISIVIDNYTKNLLYQTTEKLAYYPGSLYSIHKKQSVKLLGSNNYQVTGKFK